MADTIINATEFDLNQIGYSKKKANDYGGTSVNVLNKRTNCGLRLALPMMMTWGAEEYKDDGGKISYSMSLQFPSEEYSDPESEAVLQMMIGMEQKIKEDALDKSKDWFGKEYKSLDIIDALCTPMLKYTKIKGTQDPDFSKKPSLKLKLAFYKGEFKLELYDEDSQPLFPKLNSTKTPLDYLPKLSKVICVIQTSGIWFSNGKMSITWKLLQAIVNKPRATIQGVCMVAINPSDKTKFAEQPDVDVLDEDGVGIEIVADSEDEDEAEHVEVAPVVEVAPAPVVEVAPASVEVAPVVADKPKRVLRVKKASA